MNSEEVTSSEAQTLESAYSNNPYSSGGASGFSLQASQIIGLLNISQSATVAVYWGRSNSNITGIVVAASNTDGSILSGTGYYSNGQGVTQSAAQNLMASYDANPDTDSGDLIAVFFERSHIQQIISTSGITSVDFSFAREVDDSLNVVATNDLGTVYFNRSRGIRKPK